VRRVYYTSFTEGTKTFGGIKNYFRLATELNSSTTAVVVQGTIPDHTKTSGTLEIRRDTGTLISVAYSGYSGSTFTISNTDFSGTNICGAGKQVLAEVNFASAPASAGKLLQLQSCGSFMDLRDIGGNIVIRGGDIASPLKNPSVTVQHESTNIIIENVANNNILPFTVLNTSGNELEGWPGLHIKENGRSAYGIKSRLDWSSEGDLLIFALALPTNGQVNGTSVEYGGNTVTGVKLATNRPHIQVYCPSNASIYLQARVTADNTIAISVANLSGSNISGSLNVYGIYKSCYKSRLLD
jgi:hypothetical protein